MGKAKKQIIYAAIYIGLMVAIPALPLKGLVFVGGVIRGITEGIASNVDMGWLDFLNPYK